MPEDENAGNIFLETLDWICNKLELFSIPYREVFIISPEDLIISKLIWNKSAGGSERQIKDCESILKLNRENLDLEYIKKWARVLKIEDEFNKLWF